MKKTATKTASAATAKTTKKVIRIKNGKHSCNTCF